MQIQQQPPVCLSFLSWSFFLSGLSVCLDTRNCYHYGQFHTFGLFVWIRGTATIMASFTHSVCLPGYEELLPLWPVSHIRSVCLDTRNCYHYGQFHTFGLFAWIRGTATIMASFTHSVCLSGYEELLPLWPVSHIRSVCLETRNCYHYGQFHTFGLFAWIRGTATIMASFTHSVCFPGYEELLPLWPVLHIRSVCLDTRNCYHYGQFHTFGHPNSNKGRVMRVVVVFPSPSSTRFFLQSLGPFSSA